MRGHPCHPDCFATISVSADDVDLSPSHIECLSDKPNQRVVGLSVGRRRGDLKFEPAVVNSYHSGSCGPRRDHNRKQDMIALLLDPRRHDESLSHEPTLQNLGAPGMHVGRRGSADAVENRHRSVL